jgi:starch phosphorylase
VTNAIGTGAAAAARGLPAARGSSTRGAAVVPQVSCRPMCFDFDLDTGCASLDAQPCWRRFRAAGNDWPALPDKVAMQLNDTHPTLAVPELMRILLDDAKLGWDEAWDLTQRTLAYTNHTLLPEALEKWPLAWFELLAPRHLEIIFEINHRLLDAVRHRFPGDEGRVVRTSLIEEGPEKHVRMANLAIVGSHAINGVSRLHSELIKTSLVPDFAQLWPERFSNKTNGVAPRRWILKANPGLASLLTRTVGEEWITDLEKVRAIEKSAGDPAFLEEFREIKRRNKEKLAREVFNTTAVVIDPHSMFDVHVKRIHEYKRQLLNVMRVIHEYLSMVEDGADPQIQRTYIFAGKSAPGYWAAKQIIKLINNVAHVVNTDPRAKDRIKAVFVPDYRVSLAEIIMPAADLSQQISTAGMEASGTGNMKLAMNGALTLGTLDGANIEIMEAVGEENIYTFGLTREDVNWYQESKSYNPREVYNKDAIVRRVVDTLASNRFCPDEPGLFRWIVDELLDRFLEFNLSAVLCGPHRPGEEGVRSRGRGRHGDVADGRDGHDLRPRADRGRAEDADQRR